MKEVSASSALAQAFVNAYPRDAVRALSAADPQSSAAVLSRCSATGAAEALRLLDPAYAAALLVCQPPDRLTAILAELSTGLTARILRSATTEDRQRLMGIVPPDLARSLSRMLEQSSETVGAAMDPLVASVPAGLTAREARQRLRRSSSQAEYYVYVIDSAHMPIGVVNLRQLLLAAPSTPLESLMRSPVAQVRARTPVKAALALPEWDELHALPVVDHLGTLVGVLPYSTMHQLRSANALDAATKLEAGGVGMAITELAWTMAVTVVEELAGTARLRHEDTRVRGEEDKREDDH